MKDGSPLIRRLADLGSSDAAIWDGTKRVHSVCPKIRKSFFPSTRAEESKRWLRQNLLNLVLWIRRTICWNVSRSWESKTRVLEKEGRAGRFRVRENRPRDDGLAVSLKKNARTTRSDRLAEFRVRKSEPSSNSNSNSNGYTPRIWRFPKPIKRV